MNETLTSGFKLEDKNKKVIELSQRYATKNKDTGLMLFQNADLQVANKVITNKKEMKEKKMFAPADNEMAFGVRKVSS